jgi:acid phosphatase type 7
MKRAHAPGVRWIVTLAAALALAALLAVSALARSRSPHEHAAAAAPLRVVLYATASVRSTGRSTARPAPSTPQTGVAAVKSRLAALGWARADAAIIPWAMPGSLADRRFGAVLTAMASVRTPIRVAALIDHPAGSEVAQINALATSRAVSRRYLRRGSKPVVFVAPANRAQRGCARALRWRAAARGFWLVQATFPGYGNCRAAANAWFRDTPDVRSSRTGDTFLIRPGSWPAGRSAPALARSPATWLRAIARMNASGARLQIVDSLNDWSRGTAIEPSAAWPSASGFGSYLDALHTQGPGGTPPSTPAVVESAAISDLSAHQVSVTATVSGGGAGAALWVEFGTSLAYGQVTAPVAVNRAGPRQTVMVVIPSLSAATAYHARVSVTSTLGSAMSADLAFTTLSDPSTVRLAAAGDIACDPSSPDFQGGLGTATACHQMGVAGAILAGGYDTVLPLGDEQYNSGTAADFAASYDPSWGRFKAISHPVVGNHEYGSPGAAPYYQYFGPAAGEAGQGWYSYELGSWHVIAINSNCAQVAGCGVGSPQDSWLRADLALHPARCTLAYWHHPLFTSGQEGDSESMATIWTDLFDAGADVVLNGHDHDYERFAPQNGQGQLDAARGMREFVVGTGGKNHMNFRAIEPNSEVHDNTSFGFLELTLGEGGYSWRFVSDPPGGFSDSGSGSCH